MPTIQHSALTTGELHEPKGTAAASANKVFVADGAGSGSFKTAYTQGFEDYNDSGSSQSLTSGAFIDLTNDGAGPNTEKSYQLPGFNDVWDTTNNEFRWDTAGLSVGDTVAIRFDFDVTTSGANHEIAFGMDVAHGHADEFRLIFERRDFKTAGTYNLTRWMGGYIGSAAILNNPAKVIMFSDNAGDSVVVNGWYIRMIPRNPVYA